jgi:lipopolysaccharide transport protein LptA
MFYKLIFVLATLSTQLFGVDENEVRIEANIFEANEKERLSIFSGDVKIHKGNDELNSSTVKIYFDSANQPERYEFLENVSFKIHIRENSTYLGKADKVYLFPTVEKYIFSESVEILELETGRKIEGNKVSLDGTSGSARIIGDDKKPVVMSFKIEKKDKDSGEKK